MTQKAPHWTSKICGVLLAAGDGTRLGYPKSALRLQGRWMLPRLIQAMHRGGCQDVLLVLSPSSKDAIADFGDTGADQEILHLGIAAERTGSIQSGLANLPENTDAVILHSCDIPLLRPSVVQKLIAAWFALPDRNHRMVRPKTPAGRGGHPLLLGKGLLQEVQELAPKQALRDFVRKDPSRCLDLTLRGDPGPFLDVNTPEQLTLIEGLLQD